jgi:formate hydrogenlyase subunit 3/multisubunit Na+/H+ antiporter MnhD subunit
MDRLLGVMAIFVDYPLLAAAVGAFLVALGRRTHRRVAEAAGATWLLYALYEFGMKQRWLCSGECNIRIDLLAIYPVLLVVLIAGCISLLRAPAGSRPAA